MMGGRPTGRTSKVKGAGNCLAVCGRQRTGASVSSKNSSRMGEV